MLDYASKNCIAASQRIFMAREHTGGRALPTCIIYIYILCMLLCMLLCSLTNFLPCHAHTGHFCNQIFCVCMFAWMCVLLCFHCSLTMVRSNLLNTKFIKFYNYLMEGIIISDQNPLTFMIPIYSTEPKPRHNWAYKL